MFLLGNAEKNQLIEHAENKYYDPSYEIDLSERKDAKALIANRIKEKSVCLDVGCGGGYLGDVLFKHKKATTYGVELDKKAVKCAKKNGGYADVYNFSVTERKGKEYDRFIKADLKFDYIIFADILEHLVSPDEVLVFFAKYLKPKGKILISLPNIAHFDIIRGLFNGNFNYNHVGLLDNTHLRFFTKNSFKQFIWQINDVYSRNFSVKVVDGTVALPDYIESYPNLYGKLNRNDEACILQFIYEITITKRRNKSEEKTSGDFFLDEVEGLLEWRNQLEEEVKGINSSISWKITKPLREVAAVFKRAKKK